MKKRVLVYPCGTEIALEIYRSVCYSTHFELIGGVCSHDHGEYVYQNCVYDMPFLTDSSIEEELIAFNQVLNENKIDIIYPAMDGVLYCLKKFENRIDAAIVGSDYPTVEITRHKSKTYNVLEKKILTPQAYHTVDEISKYPIFIKPDIGQGAVGAKKIIDKQHLELELNSTKCQLLLLEYLPGKEVTVDCFSNIYGKLIFCQGRTRKRIKNGISVNSVLEKNEVFPKIAEIINQHIPQKGGWFFQLKENENGEYCLLEVASRIAGTSGFTRAMGVNLPLLSLFTTIGQPIDKVFLNSYDLEMDRALYNAYKLNLKVDAVYIDYDDTLVVNGNVNLTAISFLYHCLNKKIKIILLTKHKGDIKEELFLRKLSIFDEIIHLSSTEKKVDYIHNMNSIFIDDSYGERFIVKQELGIDVFDTHMLECLYYV